MTPVPARVGSVSATPRAGRSEIERPRLVKALHRAVGSGLIVVHAPAGFGKTAVLAQFAREVNVSYDVRWLALDGSCTVPEVFAARLAQALLGDAPVLEPYAVGRTGDLKAYLSAALKDAVRGGAPIMLVLDNVQLLGYDEIGIDLLGWLIETAPEGTEIVLSGRELPSLSLLDERIATGEATLVGSAELAFDEGEVAHACERAAAEMAPAAVREATDGWPVGVMAILSGTVSPATSRERQQGAAWGRYLGSQVLSMVPEGLQPALLKLSLPEEIDAGVAELLAISEEWRALAAWLEEHGFLYEPLPGDRFRLNPLLRSHLQEQFARTSPEEFEASTLALGVRYEREGNLAQAFELARAPGQHEFLAALIERHALQLIHQGAFSLLWHVLQSLPAETIADRPLIAAVRARVLSHIGRLPEGLTAADAVLSFDHIEGAARVHATLAKMRALRLLGKTADAVAVVNQLWAIDCDDPAVLGELAYHEAEISMSVLADLERAERLLQQTLAQCDPDALHPLGLLALSTLGQLLTMRGDGPGAVETLQRAVRGWRSVGRSSNLGWVLNNLGMAYLQVGDFRSAADALGEAREEGLRCENQRNVGYATASLGDAELALGRWQKAKERYEEAIRICAEDAPDETLAALSIAGYAASLLGLGDVQQADYFVKRATLVAVASGNSFEIATCKQQEAAVESAAGNHVGAVNAASEAVALFREMNTRSSLCAAYYRLALCQFRAGRRNESQQTLHELDALLTAPWMAGVLMPLVREHPMFAQWVASRNLAGKAFREMIERHGFDDGEAAEPEEQVRYPHVVARSLGAVSVQVGGREVAEEAWSSMRAKELFFLFLANRGGLRKEAAVEQLYPEIEPEKCNSAFHSNLYRLRRALYPDSVVKRDGAYLLNPEGTFTWDVEQFQALLDRAAGLPAGGKERAELYNEALCLYQGPFADAFHSEWAEGVRRRQEEQAHRTLAVLAGYHAAREEWDLAAGCLERILAEDRYNEEAAYQLATMRTRGGHTVAALAFLDDYRRTYEDELGEELPERFARLRARIANGLSA